MKKNPLLENFDHGVLLRTVVIFSRVLNKTIVGLKQCRGPAERSFVLSKKKAVSRAAEWNPCMSFMLVIRTLQFALSCGGARTFCVCFFDAFVPVF